MAKKKEVKTVPLKDRINSLPLGKTLYILKDGDKPALKRTGFKK